MVCQSLMDKIFAFIVLVLTWHMYVDDSVTKGPQNNQFFCCKGSIQSKIAQTQLFCPKLMVCQSLMDKIVGLIVLVLAWHMRGDNSVTKGPQTNHYSCCYCSIWRKIPQNQLFSPKIMVCQSLMDNIFGLNVLVVAGHICWDDLVTKGPQTNQYFCCNGSIQSKIAQKQLF